MISFQFRASLGKNFKFGQPKFSLNFDDLHPVEVESADSRYGLDQEELWKRNDVPTIDLNFTSHGYTSETEAWESAIKLKHALAMFGAFYEVALDPGFIGTNNDGLLSNNGTGGIRLVKDGKFGRGGSYYSGGVKNLTIKSNASFQDMLAKHLSGAPYPLKKIRAAAILTNQSFPGGLTCSLDHGLGTLIARVSVVEALTKKNKRSLKVQQCIDELIVFIDGFDGLDSNERDQLKNGLRNLKNESITETCKNFISSNINTEKFPPQSSDLSHLDISPAKQFGRANNFRSGFLHDGKHPEEDITDLEKHFLAKQVGWDMKHIVHQLLFNTDEEK